MVDIHCHILPGIDDGAKSLDVALEMCRLAEQDGIHHIVATPHANNEFTYNRDQFSEKLRELAALAPSTLQFSLGCDFHFSYDNVEDALVHPDRYVIGSSPYLLIELSDFSIPPSFLDHIARLQAAGLKPVLTHPERNPIIQGRPSQVLEWVDAGCIVQITASSVTGFWGRVPRKLSRWLLDHDAVHVLATDAHDVKHRVPNLSNARDVIARWIDDSTAKALVEDNPAAIVAGKELPFYPVPLQ